MKLVQLRLSNKEVNNVGACLGNMYIDGELFTFTVEDIVREHGTKIKGETAIPAGKYKITFRDIDSPKRRSYRTRYPDWFVNHLWIRDVPNFKYCYLHVGNTPADSEGCVLINGKLNAKANKGEESGIAFKAFYLKVKAALNRDEEVTLDIRDVFDSV